MRNLRQTVSLAAIVLLTGTAIACAPDASTTAPALGAADVAAPRRTSTASWSVAGLRRVMYAPFGYTLRAARDSELRADAIGIDVRRHRWLAFILAGAAATCAAVSGAWREGARVISGAPARIAGRPRP